MGRHRPRTSLGNLARRCTLTLSALTLASALLAHDSQSALELGRAAFESRRYRTAITHLKAATTEAPDDSEAFYLLGTAYWGEDRPYPISSNKAIDALRHAVELDGDGSVGLPALEYLATVYLRNERLPEARRSYQQLLKHEMREEIVLLYLTRIDEIDLDTGRYVPTPQNPRNARGEVVDNVIARLRKVEESEQYSPQITQANAYSSGKPIAPLNIVAVPGQEGGARFATITFDQPKGWENELL